MRFIAFIEENSTHLGLKKNASPLITNKLPDVSVERKL
jgi:hypothetical protein